MPIAAAVPSLNVHTAPICCADGPKKAPSMCPVAEPDRMYGDDETGAEVTAVLPVNRFDPAAMLALTETSFHGAPSTGPSACECLIPVNAPVSLPLAKSAEKFASPPKDASVTRPLTGAKTQPFARPANDAWPVAGIAGGGVS